MELILIVDDDLNNLKVLSGLLKSRYRLKVATGGEEALRLAAAEPIPDLVLLDIMMPEMDGYEVCRRLKAQEKTRDIPVIFLTAMTSTEDETRGLEAGAADFLSKPISRPIMLARIKTHLQLGGVIRQSKTLLFATSDHLVREALARVQSDEGLRRLQEIKTVILHLLETLLEPMTLQEQLEAALEIIGSISWMKVHAKGAIFLAEPDGTLVLMAKQGLNDVVLERCKRVPPGHCLCGRSAQSRQILITEHVDERHEVSYPGMPDHGHNILPLMSGERLLGLLQCHLPPGNVQSAEEQTLMAELAKVLGEIISHRLLEARLQVSRFELESNQEEIIRRLGTAAEFRDNETGLHIVRMSQYAARIAAAIDLPGEEREMLLLTAPMHDVGKIGIPDNILLKKGRLTDEEFQLIKTHTTIGARILAGNSPLLSAARSIALTHHEKWDGTGYPHGLAGTAIPLTGRICAIADVFDALTMERPYKPAWSAERAAELVRNESGRHFDPRLVEAFLACLPEILTIKETYHDSFARNDLSVFMRPLPMASRDSPLWQDRYALGIEAIDNQHRALFRLVDHLEAMLKQREAVVEICKALQELESYVQIHFADEELLMLRCNHPDYHSHKQQHQAFEKQVAESWGAVRDSSLLTGVDLVEFLRNWLVNHILGEDMKLQGLTLPPTSPLDNALLR